MLHEEGPYGIVLELIFAFDAGECMFNAALRLIRRQIAIAEAFSFLDKKLKTFPKDQRKEICNYLGGFFRHFDEHLSKKYAEFALSDNDLSAIVKDLPAEDYISKNMRVIRESFIASVEGYAFAKKAFDEALKNDHDNLMKAVLDKAKSDLYFANEAAKCFEREGYEREGKQILDTMKNVEIKG